MKAKKFLSAILCIAMVLGTMSFTAFAGGTKEAGVNGTDYNTLQEAIDNANDNDTVTLLANIDNAGQITINKSITLDLGDYTITSSTAGEAVLRICAPDESTAINVTINAEDGGVTTTAKRLPIYAGLVGKAKTNVTINGGNYESAQVSAVYQNNGLCTINGGSYKSDENERLLDNYDGSDGDFMVTGGKFYGFNPACMSINAGELHNHENIATGKTAVLDNNGWYTVEDGESIFVAQVDSVYDNRDRCYTNLQDAINATKTGDNDTVTLLADIDNAEQITINKSITLDLGDYTITSNTAGEAVLRICAPDESTAINVTINATDGGVTTTAKRLPIYAGYIGMAKTNVTINGGNYESAQVSAVYQNNGLCTINGGSYKSAENERLLDNYDGSDGDFMVTGGKFYGFTPACMSINAGELHNHGNIATGKTAVLDNNGWYTVEDGESIFVAQVDSVYDNRDRCYTLLSDAINAAKKADGDFVVMVDNVNIDLVDVQAAFAKGIALKKTDVVNPTLPNFYKWENNVAVTDDTARSLTVVANTDVAYEKDTVTVEIKINGTAMRFADYKFKYDTNVFTCEEDDGDGEIAYQTYKQEDGDVFASGEVLATYTLKVIPQQNDNVSTTLSLSTDSKAGNDDDSINGVKANTELVNYTVTIKLKTLDTPVIKVDNQEITGTSKTINYDEKAHTFDAVTTTEDAKVEYTVLFGGNPSSIDAIKKIGTYEITYTITKDGYTPISGSFTIEIIEPLYEVEIVKDYVKGKVAVLVYTNATDVCYKYDENLMIDVTAKNYTYNETPYEKVFGYVTDPLTDEEGNNTLEKAVYAAKLTLLNPTSELLEVITVDNNLDANPGVDQYDINAAYGVYNVRSAYLTNANAMKIVLKADVSCDKVVDEKDCVAVYNAFYNPTATE